MEEGKNQGADIGIWSAAEGSRKASIGFDDTEIIGHLDKDTFMGMGLEGQSSVRIWGVGKEVETAFVG